MINFKEILEKIENNTCDANLHFSLYAMGEKEAEKLGLALSKNTSIQTIYFYGGNIGRRGGLAIAEALKHNKTLKEMEFHYAKLGTEEVQALAEALNVNQTLTKLSLDGATLDLDKGVTLAEALKENKTLKEIELFDCKLSSEGCLAIAEALMVNKTLTKLQLSKNNFNLETGRAFGEALKVNKTLKEIFFYTSKLGPLTGRPIVEALKVNRTLTTIDIAGNNLGPELGLAIAEALKVNQTLKRIFLSGNQFEREASLAIVEALKGNPSLTTISFEENIRDIIEYMNVKDEIANIVKRNEQIQSTRKDIQNLFPDAPLPTKEVQVEAKTAADSKDSKEESDTKPYQAVFDSKLYESIGNSLKELGRAGCPQPLLQEFVAEATLAICSWDNLQNNDFRIKHLKSLVNHPIVSIPLKERSLSMLSHIYLTEALNKIQKGQEKDAQEYLLLAYTAGTHGLQDENTTQDITRALSLLMGEIRVDVKDYRELLSELFKNNLEKFKALKEDYYVQCKALNLKPNTHFDDIEKAAAPDSTTKQSLTFSAPQSTAAQSALGLDEDEELFDADKSKSTKP